MFISVYLLFRSLTFKLQDGQEKSFGQETTTKKKQVKIGSSLGFTAYTETSGISIEIKTSLVDEDGKRISVSLVGPDGFHL